MNELVKVDEKGQEKLYMQQATVNELFKLAEELAHAYMARYIGADATAHRILAILTEKPVPEVMQDRMKQAMKRCFHRVEGPFQFIRQKYNVVRCIDTKTQFWIDARMTNNRLVIIKKKGIYNVN